MEPLDAFLTDRLRAERLTADHFAELRRMHQDAAVMAELGGVQTEAQTRAYLDRNLRHWNDHGHGLYIVYPRESLAPLRSPATPSSSPPRRPTPGAQAPRTPSPEPPDPIGRAVLRHVVVEGRDEVETGYAFYQAWWGRGLASEVTRAAVALGFERLGLASIVGLTTRTNAASRRVLEKCGFAEERDVVLDGTALVLYRRVIDESRRAQV